MSSIAPAVVAGLVFVLSLRRLPPLHPVQLWTGSWAVATVLYALRLLPYRDLSWLTAGLICGSVLAFALGAHLGASVGHRPPLKGRARDQARTVERAAWLLLALLAVTLAAFIAQLISRFGISPVLRLSINVKLYLSSGEAPLSGTYVAVAIAAAATCALSASLQVSRARRRLWLLAMLTCAGTVYFSTSRGFIAITLVAALATLVIAQERVSGRRLLAMMLGASAVILVSFIALGSLLGKTYSKSSIADFDNFFSRNPAVSWLALPYQDITASIPALDLLVGASSTWGRAHGCATAPVACGAIRKLGAHVVRVPVAGPFTKAPLRWNAYTFLDRFLIDGGTALTLVLVALSGIVAGYFWVRARAGSAVGIIVYAIFVPAMIGAYRQNLIEIVGIASVIGVLVFLAASQLPRLELLGRRLARTVT